MQNQNAVLKRVVSNIEKVIVGKRHAVELTLITLLCRGHVLIEDVPGVGKTSLASALAKSLSCSFKRIQFTPDIMPSDITGFSAYNPKTGEFEYKQGAALSNVVLADEINRTSPKTQASLLEAMEEGQVTVDGVTYKLPEPFIVLATQNPVEYLGTYPLPEAQMDRFMIRLSMGYPEKSDEMKMVSRFRKDNPLAELAPAADANDIITLQKAAEDIYVDIRVNEFIVKLTRATRDHPFAALGASPRASLCLYRMSQAYAMYAGRDYVLPDDVLDMASYVLEHRIIVKQEGKQKKITAGDIVSDVVSRTEAPVL